MATLNAGAEMLKGLFNWDKPVKDANGDGTVTAAENVMYYLKDIPYEVLSVLLPVGKQLIEEGLKEFIPAAIGVATAAAASGGTGKDKAAVFEQGIKAVARQTGTDLSAKGINLLREIAVSAITPAAPAQ